MCAGCGSLKACPAASSPRKNRKELLGRSRCCEALDKMVSNLCIEFGHLFEQCTLRNVAQAQNLKVCVTDEELKQRLKKFRFRKAKTNGAVVMKIDQETMTVIQDPYFEEEELEVGVVCEETLATRPVGYLASAELLVINHF